jgi:aryl-alcohol dehydrogenase-like predicted oxidoreductase
MKRVVTEIQLCYAATVTPDGKPNLSPKGSITVLSDDELARTCRLLPLVKEGFAASLTEAATRFAISHSAMGTILVGVATPQQFEDALAARKSPSVAGDRFNERIVTVQRR